MTEMMCTAVQTPEEIAQTAKTAEEVWTEYYTPLLGEAQVSYMVANFQSEQADRKSVV